VTPFPFSSTDLPSDKDTLQLMVLALIEERDQQKRRAEEQKELTEVQQRRAEAHSRQAAALGRVASREAGVGSLQEVVLRSSC
jgi:hypothetical protein